MTDQDLFLKTYEAFNPRDIDAVLATMHPRRRLAEWHGRRQVHGREAVRQYWLRQWSQNDPRVEPLNSIADESGTIVVDVHQVVRDLGGNLLLSEWSSTFIGSIKGSSIDGDTRGSPKLLTSLPLHKFILALTANLLRVNNTDSWRNSLPASFHRTIPAVLNSAQIRFSNDCWRLCRGLRSVGVTKTCSASPVPAVT